MAKWSYYNDNDPKICEWVRNLIKAGLVPDGEVDSRSITEVHPEDVRGFIQAHFFCGILGWPLALQLAGWPATRPVWTGSCPCQPYSTAGRGGGDDDPRNLWPAFRRLLAECRPEHVFGEQVASKYGRLWLAGVRADLEALGYAVGAADLCAAGLGAPHIRQRLFWVADRDATGWAQHKGRAGQAPEAGRTIVNSLARGLEYPQGDGWNERWAEPNGRGSLTRCSGSGLDNPAGDGARCGGDAQPSSNGAHDRVLGSAGAWSDAVWTPCSDGKSRRIKPRLQSLVDGLPFRLADGSTCQGTSRTDALKGIGNAIVPPLAAEFIKAYMETLA